MIKSGANKDKITHITSLAGLTNFSYAYYIAKLHANLGKQVLLIDNSAEHQLFRTVTRDEEVEVGESKNLVCITDVAWSPEPFSRVDEVVIWHGMEINKSLWKYSDLRLLFTDYNKFHVEELSKAMEGARNDVHLVFVDRSIGITPERKIADELKIGDVDVYTKLGHQIVYSDITDEACYQGLIYNGLQSFKNYTKPYKDVVIEAVYYIDSKFDKKKLTKHAQSLN